MMFWIFIGLMSVAAMGTVALPLFRQRRQADNHVSAERKYYSSRIAEIENDARHGRLDAGDAEQAKAEIARKLIAASQDAEADNRSKTGFSKTALILGALFVPILSVAVYSAIGTPPTQTIETVQNQPGEPPTIQALLSAAENRLQTNPDDAQGWIVIAPVYMRLEQYGKAVNAYRNAVRLEGRNLRLIVSLGEALMAQSNGRVTAEARALFAEAVAASPGNGIASFYLGVYALQQGNNQEALSIWQSSVDRAEGNEKWLPVVRQRIEELKAEIASSADETSKNEQDAMIAGMVEGLEARLEENPDDAEGWEMLVRSYIVLGKLTEARSALAKAFEQFKSDTDFAERMKPYQKTISEMGETETQ